jgi:hypothetical protein
VISTISVDKFETKAATFRHQLAGELCHVQVCERARGVVDHIRVGTVQLLDLGSNMFETGEAKNQGAAPLQT